MNNTRQESLSSQNMKLLALGHFHTIYIQLASSDGLALTQDQTVWVLNGADQVIFMEFWPPQACQVVDSEDTEHHFAEK